MSLLPFATGMLNWFYLMGAVGLGLGFVYWALVMLLTERENSGMQTFKYSIIYLMCLFIVMLVDHYAFPVRMVIPP